MARFAFAAVAAALVLSASGDALAWGATGHRLGGIAAMQALPAELPAFLRTPVAVADVGELSREQDRTKGAGRLHDTSRDPAHFVDIDDEGRVLGGPPFSPMPPTRAEYETALRDHGLDSWKAGWLHYAIVDGVQHLTKDFGYWRALKAAEKRARGQRRAWLAADRRRREALILQSIGHLSHYVTDGAQPLHASVNFNGWGDYPNPKGFTRARIHGPFEGDLVVSGVTLEGVRARMAPFRDCACPVEQRTVDYLTASAGQVEALYELEKAGGIAPGDPRGLAYATERVAVGASELRDLIVFAWRASAEAEVGWRPVKVSDVEAGRVDPYDALRGVD
ncbi:MAG: S1/P1 Nuclease [Phenylobacterium sp.]|nr:S1/P1 Nuclease [Phenylobacterium sp.]